jgi:3-deoxy-D-manno-octulosonate 8-phosphate phosphatase (KDO 8-P phosphatase)
MNDRLAKIRLLLLDVDGVMTDGRIVFDSNGVESKFFNVKDGHGIKMIQRAGIEVGIISGRQSQVAANRAAELGINRVYQKAIDKLAPYLDILGKTGLDDSQVAFVTKNGGGCGAVREVCDLLLKGQGIWETATARYCL